jgi:SdrD B-like domain/Dockerin type I domain
VSANGFDTLDSDAAGNGMTGNYTLVSGDNNLTVDAGAYLPATLGNFVWNDLNGNGKQDGGEPGIDGVTATLTGTDGLGNAVNLSQNTAGGGAYLFNNLVPGTYKVTFSNLPAGFVFTTQDVGANGFDTLDSDAAGNGMTGNYTLVSGDSNLTVDAGAYTFAKLGNFVWHDLNADGLQSDLEPGIQGATVRLLKDGVPTGALATTDPNGVYEFGGLAPGNYSVSFDYPAGFTIASPANVDPLDFNDSDGVGPSLTTAQVTLAAGEFNNTLDQGFYKLASLGNFVWNDLNGNGKQDGGEPGINGVTATLTGTNGLGNAVNLSQNTAGGGAYLFSNLVPGTYKVTFSNLPAGFVFTTQDVSANGFDTVDSDANPANGMTGNYILFSGENNLTVDAGIVQPAPGIQIIKDVVGQTIVAPNTLVNYTYSVTNTGGIPLSNIVVIDDNATSNFTGDDFNPTPELQTSGPFVGKNIGDLNGDNLLDATEIWKYSANVIPPVVMTVITVAGAAPISSGVLSYVPLANGDIRVFYRQDSNFNDNTYGTGSDLGWTSRGKIHTFSNLTGSDKAGFLLKYSDGTTLAQFYQDYITSSTTNIDGYATYSGYQSLGISGGDGSFVSGNSAVLKDFDSTLETNLNQAGTANNGVAYKSMILNSPTNGVNNPLPTDPKWDAVNGYSFVIDKSAFTTKSFGGVTIFDQHNSPAKVGGSNSYIPNIIGGGRVNTATVTGIGNGTAVEDDDDATVSIITGPLGSLGDRVWFDSNANGIQNSGESGIEGVKVNLAGDFDQNGSIDYTAMTITGANGIYSFAGLPAGEYYVTIDATTLPANYVQTFDLDGLATLNAAVGELAAGQNRTDFDFGYVASAPGFSIVKTADKATAAFGESVTYTYLVYNNGAQPLTNVVVKDDNGTPNDPSDDFNPTRQLDVTGNNDNILNVGDVWKYIATVTPPIQLSAVNVNGYTGAAGTLTSQKLPNGDYRITYLQSTNVNDNVYGTSAVGVWPSSHTFTNLSGSDKAGFELKDANGTTVMKFYMDYISGTSTQETPGEYAAFSNYRSLGVTGGDGSISVGSVTNLYDFDSTLEVNLNRAGYTTTIVNSPVNDPNWDVVNGYSFTVKAAAFGASTLGSVSIFDQHNSPSKLGVNSFVPTATGGEVTNIAVATATLNGGLVVAVDDATVIIGTSSGGAPTKFFVADIGVDKTFRYSAQGASVGEFGLQSGNTDPRDIAANTDGSKLWVLDKDKTVNVYAADGTAQGQWTASGLGSEPEGLTRDPSVDPQTSKNDLWIASRDRKILWYDDAASNTTGSDANDNSFEPAMSGNLKGIVTDGVYLWVVTEGSKDYVYRFTITRDLSTGDPTALTESGLWTVATANEKPTGITIDPTGASQSIWLVDEKTDTVYEYGNGRNLTSGTGVVSSSFKLDATNLAPQGIADPQWQAVEIAAAQAAVAPIVNPFHNASKAADVNDDGAITPLDALLVINHLNAARAGLSRDLAALSVFQDVNGDGVISPVDALMVINELNAKQKSADAASMQFFADLGDEKEDVDGIFANIDDILKSREVN